MNIKNTNLAIKQDNYIIEFSNQKNGIGKRFTIVCNDYKKCLKKYKEFFIFGSPLKYSENGFLMLTKKFKQRTKNHKKVIVKNAMYHINLASENGNLKTEI